MNKTRLVAAPRQTQEPVTAKPVQRPAFSLDREPSTSDSWGVRAKLNTSGASAGSHEWPGGAPRLHSVALPPMPRFADIPVAQSQTARSLPIQRKLAAQTHRLTSLPRSTTRDVTQMSATARPTQLTTLVQRIPSRESNKASKQGELEGKIAAARDSIRNLEVHIEKNSDLGEEDKNKYRLELSELGKQVAAIEKNEANAPDVAIRRVQSRLKAIAHEVGFGRS